MTTTNQLPIPVYEGNGVTTTVTFTNPVPGQNPSTWPPVDPTSVTVTFIPGTGGTPVTWTYGVGPFIQQVSTGVYSAELDTTGALGRWAVKWQGTGDCAAVSVQGFEVTPQPF